MAANLGNTGDGAQFHPGYSLVSFFESFESLRTEIDTDSLEAVRPFLTAEELEAIGLSGSFS